MSNYRNLDISTKWLIGGLLLLQLIVSAQLYLFNFVLSEVGFADYEIAKIISGKFLAILLVAIPFGYIIRGRPLLPWIKGASLFVPTTSAILLWILAYAGDPTARANYPIDFLISAVFVINGVAQSLVLIGSVPWIMRNTQRFRPEAFAGHSATWGLGSFLVGVSVTPLKWIFPELRSIDFLWIFTGISLLGPLMLFQIKNDRLPELKLKTSRAGYDWGRIGKALLPGVLLGIGSGMTIPFMNLFFESKFGMDYSQFTLLAGGSTLLVTAGAIITPHLLRSKGVLVTVVLSQSLGTLALFGLAGTDIFAATTVSFGFAIALFSLRQPLMNMSHPAVQEFLMNYVGEENQEMTTSVRTAAWSGSWFFSAQIFASMRQMGLEYSSVFITTASIYAVATLAYYFLITSVEKPEEKTSEPAAA